MSIWWLSPETFDSLRLGVYLITNEVNLKKIEFVAGVDLRQLFFQI